MNFKEGHKMDKEILIRIQQGTSGFHAHVVMKMNNGNGASFNLPKLKVDKIVSLVSTEFIDSHIELAESIIEEFPVGYEVNSVKDNSCT
jgi:hypothetical protein